MKPPFQYHYDRDWGPGIIDADGESIRSASDVSKVVRILNEAHNFLRVRGRFHTEQAYHQLENAFLDLAK